MAGSKSDATSNKEMIMPGVDFDVVSREITMQQVLDEIGFRVTHQEGDQLRGPCPVHGSTSKNSRVFSVNLTRATLLLSQVQITWQPT